MTGLPQDPNAPISREQQRRRNLKLGLILGTVAIAFFVGFIAKAVFFGL